MVPLGTGLGTQGARGAFGQNLCLKWLFTFLVGKSQSSIKSSDVLMVFLLAPESLLILSICQPNPIQYLFFYSSSFLHITASHHLQCEYWSSAAAPESSISPAECHWKRRQTATKRHETTIKRCKTRPDYYLQQAEHLHCKIVLPLGLAPKSFKE